MLTVDIETEDLWLENAELWAEIHRLRAAVKGPDGYETWQDAATDEKLKRVRLVNQVRKFNEEAKGWLDFACAETNGIEIVDDDNNCWAAMLSALYQVDIALISINEVCNAKSTQ